MKPSPARACRPGIIVGVVINVFVEKPRRRKKKEMLRPGIFGTVSRSFWRSRKSPPFSLSDILNAYPNTKHEGENNRFKPKAMKR
jgi:hypothetical protein